MRSFTTKTREILMINMVWKVSKVAVVVEEWMTFSPCSWVAAVVVVKPKNKKLELSHKPNLLMSV